MKHDESMGVRGSTIILWIAALLPWLWVIPANSYFWDDYAFRVPTSWSESNTLWSTQSKHPINLLRFLLNPYGAWPFHLISIGAMLGCAVSLRSIVRHVSIASPTDADFTALFFFALPIYYSRYSNAVLEYSVSMAAVLVAWSILISRTGAKWEVLAAGLLVFGMLVPTLSILTIFISIHRMSRSARTREQIGTESLQVKMKRLIQSWWPVAVPILIVTFYLLVINRHGKYRLSVGGSIAWARGALILCALILGVIAISRRSVLSSRIKLVLLSLGGAYLSLLGYFGVGYNPLAHVLPWRSSVEYNFENLFRFVVIAACLGGLSVAAAWCLRLASISKDLLVFGANAALLAAFCSLTLVFGPMDWESRHWIVTLPFVSAALALLTGTSKVTSTRAARSILLTIPLAATYTVAGEFVVDTMHQKAIVRELSANGILRSFSGKHPDSLIVVVADGADNSNNARQRGYRSYEWQGLLSDGLNRAQGEILVSWESEVITPAQGECTSGVPRLTAVRLSVQAVSDRWESLRRLRSDVALEVSEVLVCELELTS